MVVEIIRRPIETEMKVRSRRPIDFAWRSGLLSSVRLPAMEFEFVGSNDCRILYCGKLAERGQARVFAGTTRKEGDPTINQAIYIVNDKRSWVKFEVKISFKAREITGGLSVSCEGHRQTYRFGEDELEKLIGFVQREIMTDKFDQTVSNFRWEAIVEYLNLELV